MKYEGEKDSEQEYEETESLWWRIYKILNVKLKGNNYLQKTAKLFFSRINPF